MTNKFLANLLVPVLLLISLTAVACSTPASGAQDDFSESDARQKAELFVKNSQTFTYDGINQTLELTETLYPDIENTWQFVFQFESRHAGYGDRDGQILLQVITPHEVIITVQDGEIISALMDGAWDMTNQEMQGE